VTSGGQVVRSPINADFRPTGRSTMGVKFVTPKEGDSVAVVARSMEKVAEEAAEDAVEESGEDSAGEGTDATIEDGPAPAPEED
jgi:DNA gyrase subunit A